MILLAAQTRSKNVQIIKRLTVVAFILSWPMAGTSSAETLLDAFPTQTGVFPMSVTSTAQNRGFLDASIDVNSSRDWVELNLVLHMSAPGREFGSVALVNADVLAQDFPMTSPLFQPGIEAAQVTLKDLLTTGLGAMQAGTIDVFFDSRKLATISESHSNNAVTKTNSVSGTYRSINPGIIIQNNAFNAADITSRADVVLNDVMVTTGSVVTTAIGAMGAGDVAATVLGRLVGETVE